MCSLKNSRACTQASSESSRLGPGGYRPGHVCTGQNFETRPQAIGTPTGQPIRFQPSSGLAVAPDQVCRRPPDARVLPGGSRGSPRKTSDGGPCRSTLKALVGPPYLAQPRDRHPVVFSSSPSLDPQCGSLGPTGCFCGGRLAPSDGLLPPFPARHPSRAGRAGWPGRNGDKQRPQAKGFGRQLLPNAWQNRETR